jgi:hypothetical protein
MTTTGTQNPIPPPPSGHDDANPPTPCSLEFALPESSSYSPTHHRFAELPSDHLVWDPDTAYSPRFEERSSVTLEDRGLTPQIAPLPNSQAPKLKQDEFWARQTVYKNSLAAALREIGEVERADALENCHSYATVVQCNGCGVVRRFPNRCDKFYCPECQPHLQHERSKQVEWWARQCKQPKHVVLTIKNTETLSATDIDLIRDDFTKLRRSKFARNWLGGFYSLEVTNESRGWHLHIHALIEAKWIDAPQLAVSWHRITKGRGYIVKVRDVRDKSYLHEITKYAVKGSMLAAWQPADVMQFINAFEGKRAFGVFGSLYGVRTEFAEWIAVLKSGHKQCSCGSCSRSYYTELEWLMKDLRPDAARPPPRTNSAEQQFPLFATEYAQPR